MKTHCDELFHILTDLSPNLSPYDKERCQSRVDFLLKQINTKESSASRGSKLFQFQRKPKPTKKVARTHNATQHHYQKAITTTNEQIVVTEPTAVYEDLDHCQVTTKREHTIKNAGSFILRKVNNTLIRCQPLVFETGSLFITDCESSSIVCDLPPHNAVQVRLHNLKNCKLFLLPTDNTSKQVVILENCTNCIFHEDTKGRLEIKNFTSLNLTEDSPLDYKYESYVIQVINVSSTNQTLGG